MLDIDVAGARLRLLAQRAALLIEAGALLVADAHVGKAASFRALGVPVPRGTTGATLQRLSESIALTGARRVIFLGDLLHSAAGRAGATLAALAEWRERHADVVMQLVRGNHDRRAGDPPLSLGIEVVDEPLREHGLALCHHPNALPHDYVLAGHLHPCVVVGARAGERLRLPCFHFGAQVGVLPAFGDFTGMHEMRALPGERVFVIADAQVRALRA